MLNTEFLAKRIRQMGFNQKEFSETVGTSQAMMSYMLNGFKQPSLELAKRMSKELGCTVDDLLKD